MSKRIFNLIIYICILSIYSHIYAFEVTQSHIDEVLTQLDNEIANRDKYINNRQGRIDSLTNLMHQSYDDSANLLLTLSIGNEYVAFNNDSAIAYYHRGLEKAITLKNDSLITIFTLKRATYLPLAGFISEAVNEYNKIDSTAMPKSLKILYYESGKQMYSYLASYYAFYPNVSQSWYNKSLEAQRSLLGILDINSAEYKLNNGEYYLSLKEYTKASAILKDALNTLDENNNLYARVAHALANIASNEKETNKYIYYLALSAISDIKSATLEVVSIQILGKTLLQQGDVVRAHKYSSIALANAVRCKAYVRMIESSEAMSVIEQVHTVENDIWRKKMMYFNIGIFALFIVLVIVLIYLHFKMHRLNQLQEKLLHSNNIKEIYISQFLNLCSIYMEKLNQFNSIVNRKLSAGKIDDLYKITKSSKFIEEQSKEFYDVFDNAFLNLYPSFIDSVNDLLIPSEKITLKDDEKMNTELRILALIRLGINDSSRIAQMLNYSLNTIYTYRNKVKNKAINRDKFEKDLMKIR